MFTMKDKQQGYISGKYKIVETNKQTSVPFFGPKLALLFTRFITMSLNSPYTLRVYYDPYPAPNIN